MKEKHLIGRKVKGFKFKHEVIYYGNHMDKYVDQEGTITDYCSYGPGYSVRFNDGWSCTYPAEHIESQFTITCLEDFKIPGTKLPELKTVTGRVLGWEGDADQDMLLKGDMYSYGTALHNDVLYILAERHGYEFAQPYMIPTTTIEELAIEQGMITEKKELPKSFACQNTNQVLWDKYIVWLNSLENNSIGGTVDNNYYGIDTYGKLNSSCLKDEFDTIISLEEWNEIVNGTQIKTEKVMTNKNYYSITREQLKSIHDVACGGWKEKITEYAKRNPFGLMIEFTQAEVDTMFKAATPPQLPVLERVFGKQTSELDLSGGTVDGKELFNTHGNLDSALMCVRSSGNYGNRAFILDETYNWDLVRDTNGNLCLVPTRK